jgi:hypothetical protein
MQCLVILKAINTELLGNGLFFSKWKCWNELLSAGGVMTPSADPSWDSLYLADTSERYVLQQVAL